MTNDNSLRDLLYSVADRSASFLQSLETRAVGATATVEQLRQRFDRPMPDDPLSATEAIEDLAQGVEAGLIASAGSRYFGFVIGGATPASLAADWLTSVWDQNAQAYASSPAASVVEEVVSRWILELLDLPQESSVGFVTGCQMANFTALAIARNTLLARAGWDVVKQGLFSSPVVRVILCEEAHATVRNALYMIGIGTEQVTSLPADDHGRMDQHLLAAELARVRGPVIVSAQAGNVNSGAFEPIGRIADLLAGRNAWLHVDGAFGLWAATSPELRHLLTGLERADSWATDAHKWLNVPYDSGIVIVKNASDHLTLKIARCAYTGTMMLETRDGSAWVPENSRRARAFPLYAGLRALGRSGVQQMVERCVALAKLFAALAAQVPFFTVVNDVELNQVVLRFEPQGAHDQEALHAALAAEIQTEGTCWIGTTRWRGEAALRVSISNWSSDEKSIRHAVAALARASERVVARKL